MSKKYWLYVVLIGYSFIMALVAEPFSSVHLIAAFMSSVLSSAVLILITEFILKIKKGKKK